ncbi:MAG: DUF998 domain-containing protein [Trebonia sp.]
MDDSYPVAGVFGARFGAAWARERITAGLRALVAHRARELAARPLHVPRWVLVSSALSPVLLVGGWLVADALQPSGYSPVRQTVSVLAGYGGSFRWIMTGALIAIGCCHLLTVAGLSCVPASARVVLAIAGLAALGVAVCPEPADGSTTQHVVCTAVGAVAIAVWPAFAWTPRWSDSVILRPRTTAIVTGVFLVLLGWLIAETQNGAWLGVAERLASGVQTTWPLVIALGVWHVSRQRERTAGLESHTRQASRASV